VRRRTHCGASVVAAGRNDDWIPRDESPRDRKRLARQAGLGRLSFISALAGVLVAYGAFAVLAALVGAVTVALGLDTELAHNDGPPWAGAAPSW
jgi:hypothetical protein